MHALERGTGAQQRRSILEGLKHAIVVLTQQACI